MILRPRVVETNPTWSGTLRWTVTFRDTTGATASQSFTVIYTPTPATPQPAKGLRVGADAVVYNTVAPGRGDLGLNLRRSPSTKDSKIGNLPQGTRVKIVGGPRSQDEYTWWEVESTRGRGWCAENWLRPAP